ncbi:MAG: DUF3990 domain-containing protein [Clostridiales Family XIII bacterium]|nr:DUF3990 domain-containing protein [Clostridiales Family XIII bacterium]
MKVYHGGYRPVEMPELRSSRWNKDFGKGFYCTELQEQAERWSALHISKVARWKGKWKDANRNLTTTCSSSVPSLNI